MYTLTGESGESRPRALREMREMHNMVERMKTAEQTQRALAQREENARAKAAGLPMPFASPWDSLDDKLPEGSSREAQRRWFADLCDRHAPRR